MVYVNDRCMCKGQLLFYLHCGDNSYRYHIIFCLFDHFCLEQWKNRRKYLRCTFDKRVILGVGRVEEDVNCGSNIDVFCSIEAAH